MDEMGFSDGFQPPPSGGFEVQQVYSGGISWNICVGCYHFLKGGNWADRVEIVIVIQEG
jgi:hypothetical protein